MAYIQSGPKMDHSHAHTVGLVYWIPEKQKPNKIHGISPHRAAPTEPINLVLNDAKHEFTSHSISERTPSFKAIFLEKKKIEYKTSFLAF